jgi:cellulose synthase/poly-beta-1,6-N-acetylglucosamine synthase-like glycosyltransferase
MPLISVVVPAYNEQDFIGQCLEALLSQGIPKNEFEIIVSDSSSTDNTAKIAKRYADRVVTCKKVSAGFGRNFGAKHACGEVIAFIDADTLAGKSWLLGVKEALSEKGCVAATGPFSPLEKASFFERLYFAIWLAHIRFTITLGRPMFTGFNFAVKKKAFDEVNGFREDDMVCEDLDLSLKLAKKGKTAFNKKMAVLSSTRRLREVGILRYASFGLSYTFLKKKYTWAEHRKDW